MSLLLYPLLTAAAFYLGSRAVITTWLWSRYPARLAAFMDCAACSGFWYGAGAALVFQQPFLGLDGHAWTTPIVVGLCSIIWTPVVAAMQQRALDELGSALGEQT
jgi:hypothetical protein